MGDAILCTAALRAIRRRYDFAEITFLARRVVREVLSPCRFNDRWLMQQRGLLATVKTIRGHKFTHAILFKNSFRSALACFLAKIPLRTGYSREGRGFLLTERLYPQKEGGRFKPVSMVDYYLAVAARLGADTSDRSLELQTGEEAKKRLETKVPEAFSHNGPIVVLVPGGAFGPSKLWPSERFAQTAERLIKNYDAVVAVSAASNRLERQIASEVCAGGGSGVINLAERNLSIAELKAFFSLAELVISNDTGPRHIAIALGRKVVSLFGPNDPAWTDTGYENEIQIVSPADCRGCARAVCRQKENLCMRAITVEQVCKAAEELLEKDRTRQAL